MSSQTITVKSLGPIKDLTFEVSRFNLVIGESTVGKSTLAKAIYLFKNMRQYTRMNFISFLPRDETATIKEFNKGLLRWFEENFEKVYGYALRSCKGLFMSYTYAEGKTLAVKMGRWPSLVGDKILQELYDLYLECRSYIDPKLMRNFKNAGGNFANMHQLHVRISDIFEDTQNAYYIPTDSAVYRYSYLLRKFDDYAGSSVAAIYKDLLSLGRSLPGGSLGIEENIRDILGGLCCSYEQPEMFLLKDGVTRIPLQLLSSSQRSAFYMLYRLYFLLLEDKNSFVVIEEPESHWFASSQKKILDVIAFFANSNNNGVYVSTHSPYIMLEANNLVYAGYLADREAAEAVVGKGMLIDPKDLTVVQLLPEGSRDLVDPEEHELCTEYVDAADNIHTVYNRLIDLECQDV